MSDLKQSIEELREEFNTLKQNADLSSKKQTAEQLQQQTLEPNFWQQDNAKLIMQQMSSLEEEIQTITQMDTKFADLIELLELSEDDAQALEEIKTEFHRLEKNFRKLKLQSYLSGPYDKNQAIISVFSGQGGTEAMDWAAMLMRMYMRYFERKEWGYELVEQSDGEEAGIKSVTFLVKAPYAYGYLKGESGTHRLVRLSPFNSDNLRQTSFAGVEVVPSLESNQSTLEIKDEDLEWQFYRAGGKGGQNVNKVNTAVRLRHIPSNIVVSSQSQRNQEQNRKIALQILESKLWQIEEEKKAQTEQQLKGDHTIAGWGSQIRSYVLHPYQMVKDNRTKVETSSAQDVLDGDLEEFVQAQVAQL